MSGHLANNDRIRGSNSSTADPRRSRDCQTNGVTRLFSGGGQAAVEGDFERVEGGLPADHPATLAGVGRVEATDGEVDALERGLLVGEVAAGFDRAADAGVDPVSRFCRLATIFGSKLPSRSRGTSISTEPTSVSTVLERVPLRELPPLRPRASCLS